MQPIKKFNQATVLLLSWFQLTNWKDSGHPTDNGFESAESTYHNAGDMREMKSAWPFIQCYLLNHY